MSRDFSMPPYGVDNANSGYFAPAYGSSARALPNSAGAFNGGLVAPRHFGPTNGVGIGGRGNTFGRTAVAPSSLLPSVPGAVPAPVTPSSFSASGAYPPPPPSAPTIPFVNQSPDSRVARPAYSSTGFVAAPPPPAPSQARFHRSRSSFIPNKWTRGPGDGTFGSIWLSYGGGEYGGKNFGGGPNLSFDRKRPEELWEEEQARKRGELPAPKTKKTTTKKAAKKRTTTKKTAPATSPAARARKLLARARTQLLAHLSSPTCRLFSDANHVVAVSDDDLDDLLRAGGGDAAKVVTHLTEFDRANRKFDNFNELMQGIQEARKAHGDFGAGTEPEAEIDHTEESEAAQETEGDVEQEPQQQQVEEEEKTDASPPAAAAPKVPRAPAKKPTRAAPKKTGGRASLTSTKKAIATTTKPKKAPEAETVAPVEPAEEEEEEQAPVDSEPTVDAAPLEESKEAEAEVEVAAEPTQEVGPQADEYSPDPVAATEPAADPVAAEPVYAAEPDVAAEPAESEFPPPEAAAAEAEFPPEADTEAAAEPAAAPTDDAPTDAAPAADAADESYGDDFD